MGARGIVSIQEYLMRARPECLALVIPSLAIDPFGAGLCGADVEAAGT
jgi:hypothetical protein